MVSVSGARCGCTSNSFAVESNKDSIFKAFVIGPMQTGTMRWQFHVATIVSADDGGFFVLDPIYGGAVLKLDEWFSRSQAVSVDQKVRLYVTEPKKFGASADEYEPEELVGYNNYFTDLLEISRKAAQDAADLRSGRACRDLFGD